MNRRQFFDLTNPVLARRYLTLFQADPEAGFTLKPGIEVPARLLGFTFRANALGLHGPDNPGAPAVSFGTSFALGMSVNEGENWYEHSLRGDRWLNLGMPISLAAALRLLRRWHAGPRRLALVLYHPNFWSMTRRFLQWAEAGGDFFRLMRWSSSRWSLCRLFPRYLVRHAVYFAQRKFVCERAGGLAYKLNANYEVFPPASSVPVREALAAAFKELCDLFSEVVVIRVPLKEHVGGLKSPSLNRLRGIHEEQWLAVRGMDQRCRALEAASVLPFQLQDFLPWDTHLSAAGNRKLGLCVQRVLRTMGCGDLLLS